MFKNKLFLLVSLAVFIFYSNRAEADKIKSLITRIEKEGIKVSDKRDFQSDKEEKLMSCTSSLRDYETRGNYGVILAHMLNSRIMLGNSLVKGEIKTESVFDESGKTDPVNNFSCTFETKSNGYVNVSPLKAVYVSKRPERVCLYVDLYSDEKKLPSDSNKVFCKGQCLSRSSFGLANTPKAGSNSFESIFECSVIKGEEDIFNGHKCIKVIVGFDEVDPNKAYPNSVSYPSNCTEIKP